MAFALPALPCLAQLPSARPLTPAPPLVAPAAPQRPKRGVAQGRKAEPRDPGLPPPVYQCPIPTRNPKNTPPD